MRNEWEDRVSYFDSGNDQGWKSWLVVPSTNAGLSMSSLPYVAHITSEEAWVSQIVGGVAVREHTSESMVIGCQSISTRSRSGGVA